MDNHHVEINEAVAIDDWLGLTRIAKDIFGVCVSSRDLGKECRKNLGKGRPELECPVLWLKSRLVEIGAFPGLGKANEVKFMTYLHVFFLALIEDEAMLSLLAWDEEQIEEAEARSKIFSTQKVPRPVDRVAQRVSGIRKAFTLTELLVVMFVIMLVSVVALPTVLSGVRERSASEAARAVQGALVGARDAAIHADAKAVGTIYAGQARGIRLLPDPSFPLQYLANGQIDPSKALVSSRIVSLEPAPAYNEGFADASPALPNGFTLPVPALLVVEHGAAPDGSLNPRTSWFWNLRVGDKIRFGRPQVITNGEQIRPAEFGSSYTVVGPMVIGPAEGNAEMFVNYGQPGAASPFQTQVGAQPLNLDFLYLVNGRDDDGDGLTDEGWDGLDNNLNGVTDEAGEWEPERWMQTFASGSTNLTYQVQRRPMPSNRSTATTLPAGTVIDLTSWADTRERSRVRVNPWTGAVDLMVNADGSVFYSTPYASTASFGLADAFSHLWIADIQDIYNELPPSPNAFRLPMPADTPGWSLSSPALKGTARIVTIGRNGRLVVTDPAGAFTMNDVSAPFRRGQLGQ